MTWSRSLLLLALLAGLVYGVIYATRGSKSTGGTSGKPVSAERTWSTDEMAKDPEGYLTWADKQIASQVEKRQGLLKILAERETQVRERQKKSGADLEELTNFLERLTTALRRAEDEDRWPVQVGGKKFDREKAQSLLKELPRQIEMRRPLATDYENALKAMAAKTETFRNDIEALGRLREKIALDLDQVRLHQGVAEIEKLGRTAEEIQHYSKLLGSLAEATPDPVPPTKEGGLVSLETLLK